MVDSNDHITKKTGLTPSVSLSKSGASFAAANGSISEVGNGFYKIQLNADDTNKEGDLAYHITASGADDTSFVDYVQLNTIDDVETNIRMIWNSIKNQGAIFTALMDKLGLIEKNKGLTKPDVEDAINKGIKGIEFPKAQELTIPPFPEIKDYSNHLNEIFQSLQSLSTEFSSNKSVAVKVNTVKIENMMNQLSSKIENLPKYDSNFSSIQTLISETIGKAEASIKADNSNVSNEVKVSRQSMMNELTKLQQVFSRFDSLMTKIVIFNKKLEDLDINDKSLIKAKNAIHDEILKMNHLVNTLAIINKVSSQKEKDNALLLAFGGKR